MMSRANARPIVMKRERERAREKRKGIRRQGGRGH
jgi:hypothetical protein